jgi:ADP-ribose pyrophosphatase
VIEGYHVVEYPDWLNTVAITRGFDIVLAKEHRHGAASVITGLPSGTVHSGEEPIAAAARELREETGYTSSQFVDLGWVYANPATQNNRSWSFLALNVDLTSPTDLDQSEDIDVELSPVAEFIAAPGPEEPHGLHLATIHLVVKFLLSSRDKELADLRRVVLDAMVKRTPSP